MGRLLALPLLSTVLVLAACGGGGDDGQTVDPVEYPYPMEHPEEIQDRSHFPVGQTYDNYTSNPPTSGPHAGAPANFGISDLAVPKEMAVHNMEHAGVVVWYNCNAGEAPLTTDECAKLRNDLGAVVQATVAAGNRVLMTPYPDMDSRIALTAWGVLDTFDEFDGERVSAFINVFECAYDPEDFCG